MTARRFPITAALLLSWACTTDPNPPTAPREPEVPNNPGIQAAPPSFSLVDLGILPGGTQSGAWSINDRGDVVGLADDKTGTAQAMFVPWGGTMVRLPPFLAGGSSEAFDINSAGSRLAGRATSSGPSGPCCGRFPRRSTRWPISAAP